MEASRSVVDGCKTASAVEGLVGAPKCVLSFQTRTATGTGSPGVEGVTISRCSLVETIMELFSHEAMSVALVTSESSGVPRLCRRLTVSVVAAASVRGAMFTLEVIRFIRCMKLPPLRLKEVLRARNPRLRPNIVV